MAGIVEAFKKSDSILLDGPPTSLFFDEKGNEVNDNVQIWVGNGRNGCRNCLVH